MKERLEQFLRLEQLTPARFADILGIQRSGISHILSGRNKPSFDFIEKIIQKYPLLNIEWLITGKGRVYKDPGRDNNNSKIDLFAESNTREEQPKIIENKIIASQPPENNSINKKLPDQAIQENRENKLKKIILIYKDNTFEELISAN
jgi:transcriptional regulator with XRE-family HTH domain